MTSNLKPYPHYKSSGVEWIGDVPAHWEVRRVKHAFRRIVGGSTPSSTEAAYWDGTIIWVTPTDISKVTRLRDSQRRITKKGFDSCSTTLVPVGSLVVTSRAPVGNVALAEVPLCTNQGCKTLVPDSQVIDSTYGYQVFGILQGELQSLANGTTFTEISTNALGNVLLPIPPLAEQAAIVRYLDHTDGRIRRYLRSRERLIELLKEYRQAVIHETVTLGLDPDVPLKPSGVEWLGDMPAHWEVRRLKNICRLAYGNSLSAENRINGTVPVYGSNGQVGVHSNPNTSGQCLIVGRKGSFGKVHYSAEPVFAIDTTFFVDRRHTGANIRWLYYLLGWLHLDAVSKDSAVPGLNREDAYQHIGFYPPLAEQTAIAAYLDKQTAAIDAAMARAQREIELLSEYRTRLIVDVVTGQVDVREVAESSHLGQGDSTKGDGGKGS